MRTTRSLTLKVWWPTSRCACARGAAPERPLPVRPGRPSLREPVRHGKRVLPGPRKKSDRGFERRVRVWAQRCVTPTKTFLLALSLNAAVLSPAAATAAAEAVAAPVPPRAQGQATPWSVSLEARGLSVDETALRAAVERELVRAELPMA